MSKQRSEMSKPDRDEYETSAARGTATTKPAYVIKVEGHTIRVPAGHRMRDWDSVGDLSPLPVSTVRHVLEALAYLDWPRTCSGAHEMANHRIRYWEAWRVE